MRRRQCTTCSRRKDEDQFTLRPAVCDPCAATAGQPRRPDSAIAAVFNAWLRTQSTPLPVAAGWPSQ
jgi:hypothetical protein